MLTFDLHGGRLNDGEVVGETELFVKFVKNRRVSTGRGSLKELINKRIAYQVGAQVLAGRQLDQREKLDRSVPSKRVVAKPEESQNGGSKRKRVERGEAEESSSSAMQR
jgi:hypothetical protein